MKRRDFNRLVLGAGVSPFVAKSSLAQMSAEELPTAPWKAVAPSIIIKNSPRTYNQINVPRKLRLVADVSPFTGLGATPGKPIEM
jgi:hypothetical protein